MKRFPLIFALFFLLLQTNLSFANDVKTLEKVDLKKKLERLNFLLETDTEVFYLEANAVEGLMRQEADLAIDFYKLLSEYHYAKGEHETVISNLHHAKSFIKEKNVTEFLKVNLDLGTAFYFLNNVDSMEFYLNIVTDQVDQKDPIYPEYLLAQGMKNQLVSDYLSSIETIIEAIKILEQVKDKRKLATAYNNLAINYGYIDRLDLQLEYLLKAVSLNQELGNSYQLIMNYNNLGVNFKKLQDLEKAVYYYELAYNELLTFENPFLLAQNLMNRANIHVLKEEYDMTEQLYLECEAICEANQILYGKMLSAINLGDLYRIQKKFAQSEIKLQEALILTKSLKAKMEESLVIQNLSNLAKDRKDFEKALSYFERFHFLNDSILNQKVKAEASELRELYEVEKKENEIISLSNQKLYQQYVIALMTLGLFVLLIILILWNNKRKLAKKEVQNEALKRSHMNTLLQNKDRELKGLANQLLGMRAQLDKAKIKITSIMHADAKDHQKFKKLDTILSIKPLESMKENLDNQIKFQNKEFFNCLLNQFPDLSPAELNLCAYLRLNMSTKDIAELLNRSVRTIETTRANIRRKMVLESQDNLVSFLMGFVDSN